MNLRSLFLLAKALGLPRFARTLAFQTENSIVHDRYLRSKACTWFPFLVQQEEVHVVWRCGNVIMMHVLIQKQLDRGRSFLPPWLRRTREAARHLDRKNFHQASHLYVVSDFWDLEGEQRVGKITQSILSLSYECLNFADLVVNLCARFQYSPFFGRITDMAVRSSPAVLRSTLSCQWFSAKIDRNDYIGTSHKRLRLNWKKWESLKLNWYHDRADNFSPTTLTSGIRT